LSTEDLDPPRLAERMARQLSMPRQGASFPVDINGAANTARWITDTLPHEKSLS
jgi:predicted glycosyltransferase